jgi:hypothetical protein
MRRMTHGQDDIRVFAAFEQVARHVVGDAPDEGDDLVVSCLVTRVGLLQSALGHEVLEARRRLR